jgi:hypothetical protein
MAKQNQKSRKQRGGGVFDFLVSITDFFDKKGEVSPVTDQVLEQEHVNQVKYAAPVEKQDGGKKHKKSSKKSRSKRAKKHKKSVKR